MSESTDPPIETPSPEALSPEAPQPAVDAAANASPPATSSPKPSPEELKAAMKAFKKRIKMTQLDSDSSFTKSPLSGGKTQILGITPPNQYPKAVWDALAAEGKLKYVGQGMYELRSP